MLTSLLPWQHVAARDALARRATWPHALLVTGAQGIGKRTFATHLAHALLCEQPQAGGGACGVCASCRYAAAGQHPDLRILERVEWDEEGEAKPLAEIPIRQVRALTEWSLVSSHRGVAKVAIVDPAEAMNVAAANAMLKTLEEPPPSTFLLLLSHHPGRVAATLRSRCVRLAAPMPARDEAQRWLATQGVTEPAAVLAQAGGAPLTALRLADAAWQQERGVWLAALAKPASLSPVALATRLEAGGREERRDALALAIDWLAAWTADLARVAAGGAPQRNPDYASALQDLAPAVARPALFRYHRSLAPQRALVSHPLQPRLVAESLLLQYRELF
jgi:DNA polymerase-3 subunit delta'